MNQNSPQCQKAIEASLRCFRTCTDMLASHCLEKGGKHAEAEHVRLMMTCAEICRTTATLLLLKSRHFSELCEECAEICEDCAKSCENLHDMEECAQTCRFCAEACREMSRKASQEAHAA